MAWPEPVVGYVCPRCFARDSIVELEPAGAGYNRVFRCGYCRCVFSPTVTESGDLEGVKDD